MGQFVKGDVVVVPFPFSDLSQAKRRPALVVAELSGEDLILCLITSRWIQDEYAVSLQDKDFSKGKLPKNSYIRPNRLFTSHQKLILSVAGSINQQKLAEVEQKLIHIFTT